MNIKHILLPLSAVLLFVALPSAAQSQPEAKRNVLRVGAGINLLFGSSTTCGCASRIEYGYKINRYLEAAADIQLTANHIDFYNKHSSGLYYFGISPKLIFTPFPKVFRYIRIGASISWYHAQEFIPATLVSISTDITTGEMTELCVDQKGKIFNYDRFGLNYFARVYAIDSDRFELFLNWEPMHYLAYGEINNFGYNTTINFGVKF